MRLISNMMFLRICIHMRKVSLVFVRTSVWFVLFFLSPLSSASTSFSFRWKRVFPTSYRPRSERKRARRSLLLVLLLRSLFSHSRMSQTIVTRFLLPSSNAHGLLSRSNNSLLPRSKFTTFFLPSSNRARLAFRNDDSAGRS